MGRLSCGRALHGGERRAAQCCRRTDPRVGEWLDDARAESEAEVRMVELIDRDFRRKSAVPARLATELARLTSLSQGIWAEARAAEGRGAAEGAAAADRRGKKDRDGAGK